MKLHKKIFSILMLGLIFTVGCTTDDLDPAIDQALPVNGSIKTVDDLHTLLLGNHSTLTSSGYYGRDLIATNEVRSDNCFSNGNSGRFSTQAEYDYNDNTGFIWDNAYYLISSLNIIINTDITTLEGDQARANHIQGQAMTLRALAHYDLLRTYGQQHAGGNLGVVIQKQFVGDSGVDFYLPRSTVSEVKSDIYNDLSTAYNMMNSSYDTSKILISKMANKALESRVAIYFGDWSIAKDAAQMVVSSGAYTIASESSFVSNWASDEASNSIFELEFNLTDNSGSNGLAYIYRFPGDSPAGYGDVEVVTGVESLFESTDVRGLTGILGYQDAGTRLRNMGKYPDHINNADNIPLIRYEEVVLNLAEAMLETGDTSGALTHLNSIPSNRGASNYSSATKDNILLERRKELMFEGFRFDDLLRTGSSINVLGSNQNLMQTLNYPNNLFAFPIPNGEMNANSNMVQNDGY